MTPTPTVERVKQAIYDAAIEKPLALDLDDMARAAIKAMEPLIGKTLVDAALGRGGEGCDADGFV